MGGDSVRDTVDPGEDTAMTAHGDAPTGDALASLRAAVAALPGDGQADGQTEDQAGGFDAAEHATRFEAVHDALVAVLADVDRT